MTPDNAPTGTPLLLLRLEGLTMLIAATSAYFALGFNPWIFALLFFTPSATPI